MYYDEATDRYFTSKRDAERVIMWTRVQQGDLRAIEGFSNYTIEEDGSVWNIERARQLLPRANHEGRLSVSLVDDQGMQRSVGLARLVATHFLGYPGDDQYYDAVHINGDYSDVSIRNLKWEPRWKRHAMPGNYELDIS